MQCDFLSMLFKNEHNYVLKDLDYRSRICRIVACKLTLIGVLHCEEGHAHYDLSQVLIVAFNRIMQLVHSFMSDMADSEFLLKDDVDYSKDHGQKNEKNVGIAIGDNAMHATTPYDHRGNPSETRVATTTCAAYVTEDNIEEKGMKGE